MLGGPWETVVPGCTHDGSSVPVQVRFTVTALGDPCAPVSVIRNSGRPTLVDRFRLDRSTVPVASSVLSGTDSGLASPSSNDTVPLV